LALLGIAATAKFGAGDNQVSMPILEARERMLWNFMISRAFAGAVARGILPIGKWRHEGMTFPS
jgi:hypothetical protein